MCISYIYIAETVYGQNMGYDKSLLNNNFKYLMSQWEAWHWFDIEDNLRAGKNISGQQLY